MSVNGITALLSSGAFSPNSSDSIPDENAIQVYYNDSNHNLGLLFQSAVAADSGKLNAFIAPDTTLKGNIITGSALDSAPLNGVTFVAAITKPGTDGYGKSGGCGAKGCDCRCTKNTHNDVSIVSPIYRPIGKVSKNINNLAFTTDRKSNLYFYYQHGEKLLEHKIKPKGNQDEEAVPLEKITQPISENSPLAAFCSTGNLKTRFVYFLSKEHKICEYDCSSGNTKIVAAATDVDPTGSFDVTYDTKAKIVYLYFVSSYQHIKRVSRSISSNTFQSISGSDIVKDDSEDLTVSETTQISAAVANSKNHVFCLGEDGNIKHILDDLENSD